MEQRKSARVHQVARDLEMWKQIEDKLTERYGRKIVYDRDFLKAKQGIYKYIRDKHKGKRLSPFEKAEMQVLRGQQRGLLRQIYPNPFIRLTRNLLVFAGNVLQLTGRLAWQGTKWLIAPDQKHIITPSYANNQATKRKTTHETKPARQKQQTKTVVKQAKAVVRKLPLRARVQMPAAQGKGIRH